MYSDLVKCIPLVLGCALVLGSVRAQALPSSPTVVPADAPAIDRVPPDGASSKDERESQPLRNYLGIGGNIGVSGSSKGFSEGGVVVTMKTDLSERLSVRGITSFGGSIIDNTLALTANFPVKTASGRVQLVPYVGGGVLLRSKSNLQDLFVRGLVTGGIDVPLSSRFTATAAVNVGFIENTDVGVQLGVAYNF